MGNVMMEASQINYRGGETKMSVEQALKETSGEAAAIAALQAAVGNLQTGKADLPVIAPEFDAETGVYAVGDLVMYQGKLYEFTTAHETAGDWNSTEVTEKTVSDEIDSLKSGLTNLRYHKLAESENTGSVSSKLLSLATAYTSLPVGVRKSAMVVRNNSDVFNAINSIGAFGNIYVDVSSTTIICLDIRDGTFIYDINGTRTNDSTKVNSDVFSLWVSM